MKVIHLNNPWRHRWYWNTYCGLVYNTTVQEGWPYKSTSRREEVTCKNCLASLAKMDREYPV